MVDQLCAGDWIYGDSDRADAAGADVECIFQLRWKTAKRDDAFAARKTDVVTAAHVSPGWAVRLFLTGTERVCEEQRKIVRVDACACDSSHCA